MTENPFTRILHWLRAGYPEGVPSNDYVALLGILHRELTEVEVEELVRQLRVDGDPENAPSEDEVRQAIQRRIHEVPTAEDVKRVQARLAAGGWPLQRVSEEAQV